MDEKLHRISDSKQQRRKIVIDIASELPVFERYPWIDHYKLRLSNSGFSEADIQALTGFQGGHCSLGTS